MAQKPLIVPFALFLVLALALATNTEEKSKAAPITVAQTSITFDPATFCHLDKTTPADGIVVGGIKGDVTVTYYDPADPPPGGCGGISPYPFEITSFSLAFNSP